ncbi:MAG: glutathione S-transferase [Betaproteobacteria bacterium]|nr:glutathione S-transferase [Betaproteobacteria bacterium]
MYTLYGYKGSGSAAVEAALELAGQAYLLKSAASWDDASARAELRAANPLEQIPTLVLPDGSVLSESAAILMHLGLVHPTAGLLPSDAAARAQALRGLVFIAANCYAAISIIDYPQRWCEPADDATNQRIIAGARQRLHTHWDIFADLFTGGAAYLNGGTQVGALDLLAAVVSKWSGARAHLEKSRPAFHATLKRIEAEQHVQAVFARHWG